MCGSYKARIEALPEEINYISLLNSFIGNDFGLLHDFKKSETYLISDNYSALRSFSESNMGFEAKLCEAEEETFGTCLSVFISGEYEGQALEDIYRIMSGTGSKLLECFSVPGKESIQKLKKRVEDEMSRNTSRISRRSSGLFGNLNDSVQIDLYYGSERKRELSEQLNGLNDIAMANYSAYKVLLFLKKEDSQLSNYIKSKFTVTKETRLERIELSKVLEMSKRIDGIPLSYMQASKLLCFSNHIRHSRILRTERPERTNGITIGEYLDSGTKPFGEDICISKSSFNLGTIITGVPGTGKTVTSKFIINNLINAGCQKTVVISPTNEWNGFGTKNGMRVFRIYENSSKINFFACPSRVNKERFYENLAMLVAGASNAGPYKNSLEKCLISAFRKIYQDALVPDPAKVYEAIEDSIIDMHAKKSNTSVKYTKHGENIRASLENLRQMLMRSEFAYESGEDFQRLIEKGTVFDLSRVSNNMKPFYYAMILNQIYAIADSFDVKGEKELRLLICIEEAQLIFNEEDGSAASLDLKQRLQDFRKKGIGLILIAHSVSEIDLSIRRLMQIKLYFRQSADSARYAINDLIFGEEDYDSAVSMIKSLKNRVCALGYVNREEDSCPRSVFIKAPEYDEEQADFSEQIQTDEIKTETEVVIMGASGKTRYSVSYIKQIVKEGEFSGNTLELDGLLDSKEHELIILGAKRKENMRFGIIGGKKNVIDMKRSASASNAA